jgi:hypothetical protein
MHTRPSPGARIVVHMRNGQQLDCSCCMVITNTGAGIVIYHKKSAINEMDAVGWWPAKRISAEAAAIRSSAPRANGGEG